MRHHRRQGLTLIELLVAVAVFGIVMTIVFSGIVNALRMHSDQEAVTAAQAKLRRVVEVVSQDVRSAVFGSIVTVPYDSDEDSVSLMLLDGGTGFSVESTDPSSFPTSSQVTVITENGSDLDGKEVAVVNGNGFGVLFTVDSVSDAGNGRWTLQHGCTNDVEYTPTNMLLFEVQTLGLRYDADDETIYQRMGASAEVPFAFGITDFRIDYLYSSDTASDPVDRRTSPVVVDGVPTRSYRDGADTFLLNRLHVVTSATEVSRGNDVVRTYSGQIDLSSNQSFFVKEVRPTCATP